ncbi:predicted choloylglycine hydrolase [Solibacillus silvestris StLB046]|uniref:Predicted choloylglycine hydrolase n=1 Tax=Solibacillus silvestris (strain StLB046) TaxID=1002809 RepID=F2F4E3_SOLSS|nr:C45 family peptidase [Solibacillus silvestris]BAK14677.1 predicted choloylglycine hydrolase [Solibacillus silvestris StLB046]
MKNVTSDIIQFRGSHYEFGVYQGELLKNSPLFYNRERLYKHLDDRFSIDKIYVKQLLARFGPGIEEEIEGLAYTLGYKEEQALLHYGGYYAAHKKSGCSITTNPSYMIRNYDNDPESYDGRFVLYEPTDGGYATLGPSMQITGRMDGMNEKGLVVGYNFVNTKNRADGFVCNMIGRLLLERCATVEEGVSLLKNIPHKHSFNYVLLDAEQTMAAVEASPRNVAVRDATACTNHFKVLTEENRYRTEDSLAREHIISNAQATPLTFENAFKLMNGIENGVFATKYGAWDGTLHTVGYVPTEGKCTIALGGDALPIVIDFKSWLSGTYLPLSKIKGKLHATNGFANE